MKRTLPRAHLPLLVIVSGAPGSGKTTFAKKLADHLGVVHLERDVFFHSLNVTAGEVIDRERVGIPLFYETVTGMLKNGVSLVIDGTLYKGKSEQDVRQLQPYARLINLHCRAHDPDARFRNRYAREGKTPDWLESFTPRLKEIRPLVVDPLNLGCPVIEVETTDEYSPSLVEIAQRTHDLLP